MTNFGIGKFYQNGFMLLEGLIAILIFAFGILGLVAMNAKAVSAQSGAQYRTEAATLADQMAGAIALGVNRSSAISVATQLQDFATPTSKAEVTAWIDRVTGTSSSINNPAATPGLPGATASLQTIAVTGNVITITVSWQAPTDSAIRRNVLITHVN